MPGARPWLPPGDPGRGNGMHALRHFYASVLIDAGESASAVAEYLAPTRERYAELRADEAALEAALEAGAERAREIASETLGVVRRLMGVAEPG